MAWVPADDVCIRDQQPSCRTRFNKIIATERASPRRQRSRTDYGAAHSVHGVALPQVNHLSDRWFGNSPRRLRNTPWQTLSLANNGCGAGSIGEPFGAFCRTRAGGLLLFLMGSQDERVDAGEHHPLTLGRGIWPMVVGDTLLTHGLASAGATRSISRLGRCPIRMVRRSARLSSE